MVTRRMPLNDQLTPTKLIRFTGTSPWTLVFEGDDGEVYHLRSAVTQNQDRDSADAWIAAAVARAVSLPVVPQRIVQLPPEFLEAIRISPEHSHDEMNLTGSQIYIADRVDGSKTGPLRPFSFLPDAYVKHVVNRDDFLGMYLFDIWAERSTARSVLFRRTGRNHEIRASFINDRAVFSGQEWPRNGAAGCLCRQTRSLYNGLWSANAVQRWLKIFRIAIPQALPLAICSLPQAWRSRDHDMLRERLLRRLESLPTMLGAYSLPELAFGLRADDTARANKQTSFSIA